MNKFYIATILTIFSTFSMNAQTSKKFLYLFEGTACAASAADGISTALAIGAGAHETNPFLVKKGSGDLSIPKLISIKAAFCVAPILASYIIHKKHPDSHADYIAFMPSLAATGYYSWAAAHNFGVISDIRREKSLALIGNKK